MTHFIYKNLNRKIENQSALFECLNAIGILENLDWKALYDTFVKVLHIYANGPSEDDKNIKVLLKEKGYSPIFHSKSFKGHALIRTGSHFYAFIQKGNELYQYGVCDPQYIDTFEEYTIYIQDFNHDYSKQVRQNHLYSYDDKYDFDYINLNPNGKLVGDCSIRAIASAFNCDWHKALDILSNHAYKYNELHMNKVEVVESLLIKNGFEKHKYLPVRLTCFQFAKKMDAMYPDATILVYAGDYHITSLKKENGMYVIKDAWDCSKELAGNYFVKENEEIEDIECTEKMIQHPTLGLGLIYKEEGNRLYVTFDQEDKVLSKDWVMQHCQIVEDEDEKD